MRLVEGKPAWADNRRYSADDNAQYQFEHHGAEPSGATTLDDFLDQGAPLRRRSAAAGGADPDTGPMATS